MQTKKHPLIQGTILLTATGLISRLIGFFYRMYLSGLFGEEGMGIYQLLGPVLALSFSLTAAGYQTAISKLVAARGAKKDASSFPPLLVGLSISLPLSFLCTGVLFFFAPLIGEKLLLEARTVPMIKILAFSVPLSSVHSCVNGYFYGKKKAGVPAASQLLEQVVRVGSVYLFSSYYLRQGKTPSIAVAVLGLGIGELFSMALSLFALRFEDYSANTAKRFLGSGVLHSESKSGSKGYRDTLVSLLSLYRELLSTALPLSANRIVLNLLQSVEAVSLPNNLKLYGYDTSTALRVYGVLTGMAMPLLFFPNALTGSLSVMLLPVIAENRALGNQTAVIKATRKTLVFGLILGFSCMGIFFFLGNWAGVFLFHSALAGHFLTTLSFLCPFLYLDTTLSGILQGLGGASFLFASNVSSLLLRLGILFLTVPKFGITGYLWGILSSQILLTFLYLIGLSRYLKK